MNIVELPLSSILQFEFNNKRHEEAQVKRIAHSISTVGWTQPIVVDENNVIIIGHGRYLAARLLGLATAPVEKKEGLPETLKSALRIFDNKAERDAPWDFDNLMLELGHLEDNGFDLATWGLDEFLPDDEEREEESEEEAPNTVATFTVKLPVPDSNSFEERLDELLLSYPEAAMKKKI